MLDRKSATELIETLAGDEHDWVDAKIDYYVLGLENKKAEFIKDVTSMANTSTEKDSHYIFIGVEDSSGSLVGVDEDFDDESGPTHILAADEADLQQVLAEYVSPTPDVSLYKFLEESPRFGVLEVDQVSKKPCVVQKTIDFHGNRELQRGLIYYRSGSSNTIARRSDLEQMIDERVEKRRSEILEGIRMATEIGPEAVATVGEIVHEEEDGDVVVEVGDDGDFVMEERFSREPITELDERLTIDMKRWATTDNITVDASSVWEYYTNPEQLSLDKEAIVFLTLASLEVRTHGAYWLTHLDVDDAVNVLSSVTNGHHQNVKISEMLVAIGDIDELEDFHEALSENTEISPYPKHREVCDRSVEERIETLVSDVNYDIGYEDWSDSINVTSRSPVELKQTIREVAKRLHELEQRYSGYDEFYTRKEEFRKALDGIEIALLARDSKIK